MNYLNDMQMTSRYSTYLGDDSRECEASYKDAAPASSGGCSVQRVTGPQDDNSSLLCLTPEPGFADGRQGGLSSSRSRTNVFELVGTSCLTHGARTDQNCLLLPFVPT